MLAQQDIDTDQIVPARFMATIDRAGMGDALFHDWRFGENAPSGGHHLDQIDRKAHQILVAGHNFGCGSSREHAAWALFAFGIRAIVSTGFADIFASNAAQIGILTIVVDSAIHDRLLAHSGSEVLINLEVNELSAAFLQAPESFAVDPFTRTCLLEGRDPVGWLINAIGEAGGCKSHSNLPVADLGQLFAVPSA